MSGAVILTEAIRVEGLDVRYGGRLALAGVSTSLAERRITALIGPSGCGKSTFLRCLNRMNDTIANARVTGRVLLGGSDLYAPGVDVTALRRRVGMVFQRPNPSPSRCSTTWPSAPGCSAPTGAAPSRTWWRRASVLPICGTR